MCCTLLQACYLHHDSFDGFGLTCFNFLLFVCVASELCQYYELLYLLSTLLSSQLLELLTVLAIAAMILPKRLPAGFLPRLLKHGEYNLLH